MSNDGRQQALRTLLRAGRESSRLSVMFRFAIAGRLELTVTDAECLDFLMAAGSATAGELARQANLTTGAITGMIRRLEKAGYVASERDPADRRRVIVTPVPGRLEQGKALYAAYQRDVEAAIADYTTEQLVFLEQHYNRLSAVYRDQLCALHVRTETDSPTRYEVDAR